MASNNDATKPFYTPLNAAVRWSELLDQEDEIYMATSTQLSMPRSLFAQVPPAHVEWDKKFLRLRTKFIFDALVAGDLPGYSEGKLISGDMSLHLHHVEIRHGDLKKWMKENYPEERPSFVFDEFSISKAEDVAAQHNLADGCKKNRVDNLWRAINEALPNLPKDPTARELFDYLATKDETGIIRMRNGNEMTWINTSEKESCTSLSALGKRLSKIRGI